jgi:1-phosphofructokinase family hexose kinase
VGVVPGGKGLNAARSAVLLGGRVTVVTILAGHAGQWIAEALADQGIDTRVTWGEGETRTCISLRVSTDSRLTEVYEVGDPILGETWTAFEMHVESEIRSSQACVVTMSGSLPATAPLDGYGRLCRAARHFGARALVDTQGPGLTRALVERPWLVKINAAEAYEATGIDTSSEESVVRAARMLMQGGAGSVLVTRGIAGAVLVGSDGAWRLGPLSVRGDYPVGSGDALLGGLAVGIALDEPILIAARRGVAAAVANALLPGAGRLDPSLAARLRDTVATEFISDL